jgi:hypothetical protein
VGGTVSTVVQKRGSMSVADAALISNVARIVETWYVAWAHHRAPESARGTS